MTTKKITEHEGQKYLRVAVDPTNGALHYIDVYAVLLAFDVSCPAAAHAIKKLLAPGQRGKGNKLDDLVGAQAAINRAIELETARIGLERLRQEEAARRKAEAEQEVVEEQPPQTAMSPTGKETIETIPLDKIMQQSKQIQEETEEQLETVKESVDTEGGTSVVFKDPAKAGPVKEKAEEIEKKKALNPIPFKVDVNRLTEKAAFEYLPSGAVFLYGGNVYARRKYDATCGIEPLPNAQRSDGTPIRVEKGTVVITSPEVVKLISKRVNA